MRETRNQKLLQIGREWASDILRET